ncbi:hypothetical protein ACJIZ3_022265 [Penstemon smallii]|uniref:Pentatricopeptide repeat-containing protein n=1 Tax=Penstemon smallii TaxID=265156 RepID=A0ABD3TKU8_9LAMI
MNQLKKVHAHTLKSGGTDFTKYLNHQNTRNPKHYLRPPGLIQAYSSHGPHSQSLVLYSQMLHHCFSPNARSFTFLFAACVSLSSHPFYGQMIHAGLNHEAYALTALVDMKQFDEMGFRDVPTWNSLITFTGYAKKGDLKGALRLFLDMPMRNVITWTAVISGRPRGGRPNEVTIASVLPACANLCALEVGQRIEAYARANGYYKNVFVSIAVLELYARCGEIDKAMQLFDEFVGNGNKDLCSWNTVIMSLAFHGKCDEALELFNQMLKIGMSWVILACTHRGVVSKGRKLFNSMKQRFSKLHEAYDLIKAMPLKPDSVIWGTLLGACGFHGNVELVEIAAESLYKWDGVAKLRKLMKESNVTKASHLRSGEIFSVLDNVTDEMKLNRSMIDLHSIIEEKCSWKLFDIKKNRRK